MSTASKARDFAADAARAARQTELVRALEDLRRLAAKNTERFAPFASPHEVYGVLCEEVAEFLDVVRQREDVRSPAQLRAELLDIAAVALRAAAEAHTLCATSGSKRCVRCGEQFIGALMCARGTDGEICKERGK